MRLILLLFLFPLLAFSQKLEDSNFLGASVQIDYLPYRSNNFRGAQFNSVNADYHFKLHPNHRIGAISKISFLTSNLLIEQTYDGYLFDLGLSYFTFSTNYFSEQTRLATSIAGGLSVFRNSVIDEEDEFIYSGRGYFAEWKLHLLYHFKNEYDENTPFVLKASSGFHIRQYNTPKTSTPIQSQVYYNPVTLIATPIELGVIFLL